MNAQKLPKSFKKRWVKALKSGKYNQGESLLKYEDDGHLMYCCLGVACELSGAKIVMKHEPAFITYSDGVRGVRKVPKILTGNDDTPDQLAKMNDRGDSFVQIANWIDENL